MDYQVLFNASLSVINILLGFFLKIIWDALENLKKHDARLTAELSAIQVLVAGEYVKREYFEKKMDALFDKLDKIQATAERQTNPR